MIRMLRGLAAASTLLAVVIAPQVASAADMQPFEAAAFQAAQAEGRPIVVDIAAPWCPACRAQAPIIEALAEDPADDDMAIFEVSFDDQKDVVRELGANMQSTLIAYRGTQETDRSVGETNPEAIAALFATTQAN